MTTTLPNTPISETQQSTADETAPWVYDLPDAYEKIRADTETQFEPLQLQPIEPREPSWIEEALQTIFEWLADLLSPVGGAISSGWPVLQWILIAALVAFVAYLAFRMIGPIKRRSATRQAPETAEPEWRPERAESLALLEDADRLAAQGQYDEAAHLLLQRSVGQIATARPEWVEPSSTARELAALPKLSDQAKRAFGVMSAAVESSLFALQRLSLDDWNQARDAYANFALAKIDGPAGTPSISSDKAP